MTQTQSHSTRWSPTPEQLMLLEEMYRNGVKTPNATQIQQITAQLSRYGRIQGKNVFYWFQNHKARERQKIRRWIGRIYGGYSGGRGNSPYFQFHPLLLPATQFQQPMMASQDGLCLPTDNAFHGHDQAVQEDAADNPNFCYICSKLSQGFSEESVTHEWMAMMGLDSTIKQCRGPPRTLNLFPSNHTSLTGPNNSQNYHQALVPPS